MASTPQQYIKQAQDLLRKAATDLAHDMNFVTDRKSQRTMEEAAVEVTVFADMNLKTVLERLDEIY